MNRPRIRFDGMPLWPAAAAAVIGAGMVWLGYGIGKVAALIDDARAEL